MTGVVSGKAIEAELHSLMLCKLCASLSLPIRTPSATIESANPNKSSFIVELVFSALNAVDWRRKRAIMGSIQALPTRRNVAVRQLKVEES